MDINKEREAYLKMLVGNDAISNDQADALKLMSGDSHFYTYGNQVSAAKLVLINWGWNSWVKAKAQAEPENPWVEFGFPELHKDESSDCLTSKEVFFELLNSGGTYHGWYIARPIDKRDQCCCEEEFEDSDVEYEYFFNANVGDELFDEDHISRWMYVPNVKEQSHE